jgi:hypothetical protein
VALEKCSREEKLGRGDRLLERQSMEEVGIRGGSPG